MEAKKLRSQQWFGRKGKDGFIYRAWMKNQGIPADEFVGKPVIGICNTWSELTPCNAHFRELAESVKRGILQAGGLPVEFPVMSLGETLMKPTAMLYRNLVSMDVEESIRANPVDAVVLLCGCDKTTPALLMGACSVDIPTIVVSGGPMLTGKYQGKDIGTSDIWRFAADVKAGRMSDEELNQAEAGMCRSSGHCAVMGTASSMAVMAEALGMALPGNAAIPAVDANRKVLAQYSGRRIVEMVAEDLTPSRILTKKAFENAIDVNTAIGGSTNFIIHLLAIAGRLNIDIPLDAFDGKKKDIPLLVNLQPSGQFFMEDLYYAGGLPAVMKAMEQYLHLDSVTVTGLTWEALLASSVSLNKTVIAPIDQPIKAESGFAILTGNICPNGAVLKLSAADPALYKHTGKAVVFEDIEDYKQRIDDPELEVDASSVLVLKNVGAKGYPGMPEVGNMSLPQKLVKQGVTDMVRISDGRMSGTGFGTVVLHVSPEAADNGPLGLVQNGDLISLDIHARRLDMLVAADVLEKRREQRIDFGNPQTRGYVKLFIDHVEPPHKGCDLDFLKGGSGSEVLRDSH